MKKYIAGILSIWIFLSVNNIIHLYALDHDVKKVIDYTWNIEQFLKMNYLAMPISGRCDTSLKREVYADSTETITKEISLAEYFGCDKVQIALNRKQLK